MENKDFTKRKQEHLELALLNENQTREIANFDQIELVHEALPDVNFNDIDINTNVMGQKRPPFFVGSITAGCKESEKINIDIAKACYEMKWIMGIGSQRKQLFDQKAIQELQNIRKHAPKTVIFGNIGITQLIQTPVSKIKEILEPLKASGIFVHTNPLQECLQFEGTPFFKNSFDALAKLCSSLDIPVILKETGCGFSFSTLQRLNDINLYAVDLSGLGGTHWGRIEGNRTNSPTQSKASEVFSNWGISTVDSMLNALVSKPNYKIWASGGVRSGLDAAKLIAMGAQMIGFAQPILKATLSGYSDLISLMKQIQFEYQIALFCTGCKDTKSFQKNEVWIKKI